MMCKKFEENRRIMMNLVYELNEFTEEEIKKEFFERSHSDLFITDYFTTVKDFLFSLCEDDILKYDGKKFEVIPPERRMTYRMHMLGIMV